VGASLERYSLVKHYGASIAAGRMDDSQRVSVDTREGNSLSSAGSGHWTAAFVEHIRTVHFTLVTIAAGLMLVVLTSKPYNPAIALIELEKVMELKAAWSPDLIKRIGTATDFINAGAFSEVDLPPSGTARFPCAAVDDAKLVFTCEISRGWIVENNQRGFVPDRSVFYPTDFPNTLAEFHDWWNSLAKPKTMELAERIGEGWIVVTQEKQAPANQGAPVRHRIVIGEEVTFPVPKDRIVGLSQQRIGAYGTSGGDVKFNGEINAQGATHKNIFISIKTSHAARYEIGRSNLAKVYKLDEGDFATTFTDLALAARGAEPLEFQDIRAHLLDESKTASEVLEAFGMKIPVELLTTWGTLVLLAIQLYFFVHLLELSGKLHVGDPGWDVPWIGMYNSRASKAMYFWSAVILPICAVGLLGEQSIFRRLRPGAQRISLGIEFVLLCGLICSAILAYLAWRYRPKPMVASPESNTSFE
jgi:hypothetical protein